MKQCHTIEDLNRSGFSRKMASFYLETMHHEEQSGLFSDSYTEWAHGLGFFAGNTAVYGLQEGDSTEGLLSDLNYYRSWPFNSWSRIWIDDKITLKYFLGESLASAMPEYYFYSTPTDVRPLCDCPQSGGAPSTLTEVLRVKGELACKPNNGSLSLGFTKMEYREGQYYLNGEEVTEREVVEFVSRTPNLVVTEYLHPCENFERVNRLAPTLRLIVVNETGADPRIACGYMRFGTERCGEANYTGSDSDFNYFVSVDVSTGRYGDGRCVYHDRVVESPTHPDSHVLMEGRVPAWEKVVDMVDKTARRLFNVEYMGYDITVARGDEPKIMEINSHPQIHIPQMYGTLFKEAWVKEYFRKKIK